MLRKTTGKRFFYYPRRGYGQLFESLCEAAKDSGAEFLFGARITGIEQDGQRVRGSVTKRQGHPAPSIAN